MFLRNHVRLESVSFSYCAGTVEIEHSEIENNDAGEQIGTSSCLRIIKCIAPRTFAAFLHYLSRM
jgi:hypothetical protein